MYVVLRRLKILRVTQKYFLNNQFINKKKELYLVYKECNMTFRAFILKQARRETTNGTEATLKIYEGPA